ncbi:MAG: AI-2E family transporter [Deltaproteobacteria bacterium]|nr:AI-2E family transporter [Deltaproteobacteria bacterium]
MHLDLRELFDINKKVVIWICFFLLIFLLRRFFGLIFFTFILSFILNNLIMYICRKARLNRRLVVVAVYLLFILVLTGVFYSTGPRIFIESKSFISQIPQAEAKIWAYFDQVGQNNPNFIPFLTSLRTASSSDKLFGVDRTEVINFLIKFTNFLMTFMSYMLLGILFSFLIVLDLPNFAKGLAKLKHGRFKEFYQEVADSVASFAIMVGRTFQAQMIIACLNTILTAAGMMILKIQPVAVLSVIVLMAGFIPVAGMFISSVPICIIAFNIGSFRLMFYAILMVAIVHMLEAYVLNPNIVSAIMKINPIITMIILYIGLNLFGLWGMLLSIPTVVYIFKYTMSEAPIKMSATYDE